MLVLPMDNTFLYVQPIYIQASEARMPQLRKVVLAVGNELIYRDTYQQSLADLSALQGGGAPAAEAPKEPGAAPAARPEGEARVEEIRQRLRRYRDLSAQGKWSEAGRELEAIEKLVGSGQR
jgi:uncharacterized membrane protein (UPF0182 family)